MTTRKNELSIHLEIRNSDVELFQQQGFLIFPGAIDFSEVEKLRERFPLIFAGKFDTQVYPDEWHWREGISLPDVTRHMGNAWKSDLVIARLVLSNSIAQAAATLAQWDGIRLGQDTIWWKTAGSKAITFHQDTSFMSFLNPAQTLTCWITLDQTAKDAGTLEYVPGSHRWPLTGLPEEFHAPDDYRAGMKLAAQHAGVAAPESAFVEAPPGSIAFHAGEMWHGSGPNRSKDLVRRSIGIHYLPIGTEFSDRPGGYIYRRYQLTGSNRLDESFFPVLWQGNNSPTAWISEYLHTGFRS